MFFGILLFFFFNYCKGFLLIYSCCLFKFRSLIYFEKLKIFSVIAVQFILINLIKLSYLYLSPFYEMVNYKFFNFKVTEEKQHV